MRVHNFHITVFARHSKRTFSTINQSINQTVHQYVYIYILINSQIFVAWKLPVILKHRNCHLTSRQKCNAHATESLMWRRTATKPQPQPQQRAKRSPPTIELYAGDSQHIHTHTYTRTRTALIADSVRHVAFNAKLSPPPINSPLPLGWIQLTIISARLRHLKFATFRCFWRVASHKSSPLAATMTPPTRCRADESMNYEQRSAVSARIWQGVGCSKRPSL